MKRQVSSFSCKALAGANSLSKVMTGFTAAGASNYRPFGEYVMCTSSKSVRFEEPEAVLQLLVLTMQASADSTPAQMCCESTP
ncbi:TPA: hypothetical protein ACH3X3_010249 [Trebouxia sp. C0006]